MLGCKYFLFVCRCCLHSVAWFYYWIDNHGFITEGNTFLCCNCIILSSSGKYQRISQVAGRISGAVTGDTSSKSIKYLRINFHLLAITLFSICLSFSSPPLLKHFIEKHKIALLCCFACLFGIIVCLLEIRNKKLMDPHPLANLFKRSNYDEPIASELSSLDYLYEVFLRFVNLKIVMKC